MQVTPPKPPGHPMLRRLRLPTALLLVVVLMRCDRSLASHYALTTCVVDGSTPAHYHAEQLQDQSLTTRRWAVRVLARLTQPATFARLPAGSRMMIAQVTADVASQYRDVLWYSFRLAEHLNARDLAHYQDALANPIHISELMRVGWSGLSEQLRAQQAEQPSLAPTVSAKDPSSSPTAGAVGLSSSPTAGAVGLSSSPTAGAVGSYQGWEPAKDPSVTSWRSRFVTPYVEVWSLDYTLRLQSKSMIGAVLARSLRDRGRLHDHTATLGLAAGLCTAASRLEMSWNLLAAVLHDAPGCGEPGLSIEGGPEDDVVETVAALTTAGRQLQALLGAERAPRQMSGPSRGLR
jgi:hypothetical protein